MEGRKEKGRKVDGRSPSRRIKRVREVLGLAVTGRLEKLERMGWGVHGRA